MDNQQGQPPQWTPQSGQSPVWYPPTQGWGSPQQNTQYPPQWQPRPQYPQQPYQPPTTYYPPYQQQYYQPMPPVMQQPPKKRSLLWLWILLGAVGLLFCSCFGFAAIGASHQQAQSTGAISASTQATDAPTVPTGTWTVTHTYKGNGEKKTEIFTVGNDWKIDYACTGFTDGTGLEGDISVTVYGADNSYIDLPVNEQCPAGKNTTGESEEHQGGSVYLDISASGGGWVVQVQELQ